MSGRSELSFLPPNMTTMKCLALFLTVLAAVQPNVTAFGRAPLARPQTNLPSAVEAPSAASELSARASRLKKVLEKEYITFFDPMVDSWYAPGVSFRDPMTSLSGVDSCENFFERVISRGRRKPAQYLHLSTFRMSRSKQC